MFSGVLALLERSLRVDSRAWGPHLARFGLMACIYVSVCYAITTSAAFGAPGLHFFRSVMYLDLVFMTLLGIGFFSTAISEEKEEDTLGLMLMAGIGPLGILIGKSVGRLIQALLLIAVQYPFTQLAVTLGGVTQDQVRSAYVAMFAYLIMLAGIGLLCSTLAHRNRSASLRLTIFVFFYWAVPVFCSWPVGVGGMSLIYTEILTWIAESCVLLQVESIFTTGYRGSLLSHQVITNVVIGLVGFVSSWAFFGLAVHDPVTEASPRGLAARNRGRIRIFSAGRPALNPFVWKDFHFVAGGYAMVLCRFMFYASVYLVVLYLNVSDFGINDQRRTTGTYLVLLMFLITLDLAWLVSRSLHEEVRGQMLATLMMLPKSTGGILYAKAIGTLLGWLPGVCCMAIGISVLPSGAENAIDFFSAPGPPILLISLLLIVPHLAGLMAMFLRWGAIPIAIGITIEIGFLMGLIIEEFNIAVDSPVVFVLGFMLLGVCAGCHIGIWLKTESLSAR